MLGIGAFFGLLTAVASATVTLQSGPFLLG